MKHLAAANRRLLILALMLVLAACTPVDTRSIEEQIATQLLLTVTLPTNETGRTAQDKSRAAVAAAGQQQGFTGQRSDEINLIEVVLQQHSLRKISQWSIRSLGVEAVLAEPRRRDRDSLETLIQELERDGRVESVQKVNSFKLLAYNDPYFELQNAVQGDDIERVHDLATGKDVVVAIVDTGVDRRHPELADRIVYSRNHVAHDQQRFDSDEHGTAVAGIIGSAANNKVGIVGVAPEVGLMAMKACWEGEGHRSAACDSASLAKALIDVHSQRPDILNLSLAGPEDPLIRRLLLAISRNGTVILAADEGGRVAAFPASMPEVIAVGRPLDGGEGTAGLLAPGTDVLTTTPGATYAFKSGSSMATAYVSGVAALVMEREPGFSAAQVRDRLQHSARGQASAQPVVNICAAIRQGSETCQTGSIVMVSEPPGVSGR